MGIADNVKAHAAERAGAQKARILKTGAVEVYGIMPNTSTVGWYFAGWRDDVLRLMAAEKAVSGKQRSGNAPGQGRQAKIAPGERPVVVRAMVSPKQRDGFLQLGGSSWLRSAIDAASLPDTAGEKIRPIIGYHNSKGE